MALLKIILFLGCVAIATCQIVNVNDLDCKWTGCEGKMRSGNSVCKEYGFGVFINRTDKSDCGFSAEKCLCCKLTPLNRNCKWTRGCYGTYYGHGWVCNHEFGSGYSKPSRNIGCGWFVTRYECCK